MTEQDGERRSEQAARHGLIHVGSSPARSEQRDLAQTQAPAARIAPRTVQLCLSSRRGQSPRRRVAVQPCRSGLTEIPGKSQLPTVVSQPYPRPHCFLQKGKMRGGIVNLPLLQLSSLQRFALHVGPALLRTRIKMFNWVSIWEKTLRDVPLLPSRPV